METIFQVTHSAGPSQGCSGDLRSPQNVLINPDSTFQQRTLISALSDTKSTGLPGGSAVKNRLPMEEVQEMRVRSLGQEDPLEKEMATHSSILA